MHEVGLRSSNCLYSVCRQLRCAAMLAVAMLVLLHKKFLPLVDCCSGEVILHCYIIDCIDYVTGIGNVIQAPGHSVLRANTFSMGMAAG